MTVAKLVSRYWPVSLSLTESRTHKTAHGHRHEHEHEHKHRVVMPGRSCEKTVGYVELQLEGEVWIRIPRSVLRSLPRPGEERVSFSAPLWPDSSPGATSAHILSVAIPHKSASLLHSAVWAVTGWGTRYFAFVPVSVLLHFHSLFMLFFLLAYFLVLSSALASIFISLCQLPQPVWFTRFYSHFFFIINSKLPAFSLNAWYAVTSSYCPHTCISE